MSIVVASTQNRTVLSASLGAVARRCKAAGVELVVAWSGYPAQLAALKRATPGVRFVSSPPGSTAETLRGLGVAETSGDVVAFLDGDDLGDEPRLAMLLSLAADDEGSSEPVEAPGDWASFLDRSGVFPPATGEETTNPLGLHRGQLAVRSMRAAARFHLHPAADAPRSASVRDFLKTAASVPITRASYGLADFCVDLCRSARESARRRALVHSSGSRWRSATAVLTLPLALTREMSRLLDAAGRKRMGGALFASACAWTLGELGAVLASSPTHVAQRTIETPLRATD